MSRIIKKFLILFTLALILVGCTVNEEKEKEDKKELSISIEASIDDTIQNDDEAVIPYKFIIKQVMSDDSTQEYSGVIHVMDDGTLFSYGQVDNNVDGLISVLQDYDSEDDFKKTLIMRSNFDQEKDSPTYIHKIKWNKDHFEIFDQELILNK